MDLRIQGGGRVSWDKVSGMDIYTLPNVKQIASGKQPHSTGRLAQCFVTTWRVGIGRVGERHKEGIWGGGTVSCDKVREKHGHIYTTKRKVDS